MLLALRGEKEKKKFVQNRLYNRKKKKGNCETALGTLSF